MKTAQLVHQGSLPRGEPRPMTPRVQPNPFWDDRTCRSGCRRVLQPDTYSMSGAQNRYLSQGQISAPGGVLGLTAPSFWESWSDQEHWFRLSLWLTAWRETREAEVTGC